VTTSRSTTDFGERFAVAAIGGEGVLLDLRSGWLFRVDGAALVVCRALCRGAGKAEAAADLARRFDVSRARARSDIDALVADLHRESTPRRASWLTFRRARSGATYDMMFEGQTALSIDRATGEVSTARRASPLLRLAAPHVLALEGRHVLHASAAAIGGKVVAFVGPSGVGKSTIARMLMQQGHRIVSRDLLVVDHARDVLVDAERAIGSWSRKESAKRERSPIACVRRARAPLGAVWLIERSAEAVDVRPLRGAAAMAALFANAFVELPDPRVWCEALALCRTLAARRLVYRARVPEGLAPLRAALRAWFAPRSRFKP
jgi:hypothetical protein